MGSRTHRKSIIFGWLTASRSSFKLKGYYFTIGYPPHATSGKSSSTPCLRQQSDVVWAHMKQTKSDIHALLCRSSGGKVGVAEPWLKITFLVLWIKFIEACDDAYGVPGRIGCAVCGVCVPAVWLLAASIIISRHVHFPFTSAEST